MVAVAPRSTWIHCGSAKAEDQRVPASPSTAAVAGVPAVSVDEAATGLPCESRPTAASAVTAVATRYPTNRLATTAIAIRRRTRAIGAGSVGTMALPRLWGDDRRRALSRQSLPHP